MCGVDLWDVGGFVNLVAGQEFKAGLGGMEDFHPAQVGARCRKEWRMEDLIQLPIHESRVTPKSR